MINGRFDSICTLDISSTVDGLYGLGYYALGSLFFFFFFWAREPLIFASSFGPI